MVVQHNISALKVFNNMQYQSKQVSKALERLSSGSKINSAADDAAGLGVSERMRSQIRGLKMATQNAQNSISILQTAEGGLNEQHAIAQRMRELAIQASNGTLSDEDRALLQKEYEAIREEIDRISESTEFNGIKLLNGSPGGSKGYKGIEELGLDQTALTASGTLKGTGTINLQVNSDGAGFAALKLDDKILHAQFATSDNKIEFAMNGSTLAVSIDTSKLKSGVVTNIAVSATLVDLANALSANDSTKLVFQIGANGGADQRVGVHLDNMSSANLGDTEKGDTLSKTDIKTRDNAVKAVGVLDKTINQISSQRATIGAQINRMEHTINSLENQAENLQSAESSIRDADMAEEMMNFVKHNILLQAAQAMLSQAMRKPEEILQLLK